MGTLDRSKRPLLAIAGITASLQVLRPGPGPHAGEPEWAGRPNVIVVVADDERHDMMSNSGNPIVRTPHKDKLAEDGVKFVNAFCTSAICVPSRGTILTGKYAHQCGSYPITWHQHSLFLDGQKTFPEILRENGYYTAHIGKGHFQTRREVRRHVPDSYDHWVYWGHAEYFGPELNVNGEKVRHEGHVDDVLTDKAVDFLGSRRGERKPFCLVLALTSPHIPFAYPDRQSKLYGDKEIPKPSTYNEYLDFKEAGKPGLHNSKLVVESKRFGLGMFDNTWRTYSHKYYRSSRNTDDSVGALREALNANGLDKNTVVVFTSDHGYSLGEHGLSEKHYGYESDMRVPLLIHDPRSSLRGVAVSKMATLADIAPTVLDLCDVTVPDGMTGRSLSPFLRKEEGHISDWRRDFLFEFHNRGRWAEPQVVYRTDRYKLIEYTRKPFRELYDLKSDPYESRNLVHDRSAAGTLRDLSRSFEALKAREEWSKRRFFSPASWRVLGPLSRKDADALATRLSPARAGISTAPLSHRGRTYAWQTVEVDGNGACDFSGLLSSRGQALLIGVPLRRLAKNPPHILAYIDKENRPELTAYRLGRGVWLSRYHMKFPYSFVLDAETGLLLYRVDYAEGRMRVVLQIDAPGESIELVREQGEQ